MAFFTAKLFLVKKQSISGKMSSLGLVISIAVPVMVILGILIFVGRRQQSVAQKKGQARAVKESLLSLCEAFEFLLKVDDHKEIQETVLMRIKQLLETHEKALPRSEQGKAAPVDVEQLETLLKQSGKKRRVLKSDREIRYAKKQFSKVLKAFPPMLKNKALSEASMLEFRRYLRISLLEMEVDSFTAQGDVAAQRGDVTTASSYFKAARRLLIDFKMQYPEKNNRIRELSKKTAALFNGGLEEEGGSLAKELSKEDVLDKDEHGFPTDPNADEKQKF